MTPRRQLSWRARQGSIKLRDGSKDAAKNCWGDFSNPKLLPIKISFFLIMGATQCIGPYMTLFLRSVGLTKMEVGFVYSIAPLLPILSPLIAGCIADRMGNFRVLLVITVVLSGLTSLVMIFIPPARTTPNYSSHVEFDLTCEDKFILTPQLKNNDCDFFEKAIDGISLKAKHCGYICPNPVFDYPSSLQSKLKKISMRIDHDSNLYHICEFQSKSVVGHQKCYRFNTNSSYDHQNMLDSFSLHDTNLDLFLFNENFTEIEVKDPKMSNKDAKVHCPNGTVPKSITLPVISFLDNKSKITSFKQPLQETTCFYHCHVILPHNKTCKDQPNSIEHNVLLSIGLFIGSKLVMLFLIGFSYTLFEIAALAILRENSNDYGLQRVYGSIGGMVFAPLTGYLIDLIGKDHYTDYITAFVLHCVVKLICAVILSKIDLRFRRRGRRVTKNICKLFFDLESVLLILVVLISGVCYGFIENFLPWHLYDLGTTDFFIGILTTIASASALPFLALSGHICKMFGHVQAMVFGLICYGIRCIGYSLIKTPIWAIPFEILEGVTTGLLVASAVIYGSKLASKYNMATLQGILATAHYGIGKSVGSLLGGYLMTVLGAEATFQIFSGIALCLGFVYYILLKLVLQPRQAKAEKHRNDVLNMPVKIVSRPSFSERQLKTIMQKEIKQYPSETDNPKYTSTPLKIKSSKFSENCQKMDESMDNYDKLNAKSNITETSVLPYEVDNDSISNPFDPNYIEPDIHTPSVSKIKNTDEFNNKNDENNESSDEIISQKINSADHKNSDVNLAEIDDNDKPENIPQKNSDNLSDIDTNIPNVEDKIIIENKHEDKNDTIDAQEDISNQSQSDCDNNEKNTLK